MRVKAVLLRLFIVCLCATPLLATLSFAQEMLQLGQLSYSRAEAPHLRTPVTRSFSFFRRVGGVAFNAVATGENGLAVTGLRYDATAPDGQRLVVTLRATDGQSQSVRANIPDWQLVPIARFARDENGSAMTLFGQLQNKQLAKDLIDKRGRVINYHPALDNTLVGLRLMQADILIIQPDAAHLFRVGGRLLLGAGETGHDAERNAERFARVSDWQRQQSEIGNRYQSYVVGDLDQTVQFAVRDNRLVFFGEPFWMAWHSKFDQATIQARAVELLPRYRTLAKEHDDMVDAHNAGLATMSESQRQVSAFRISLKRSAIQEMEKSLEDIQAVETMPAFSAALSDVIRQNDGINPIVYSTVRRVMRFRALFKHFQAGDRAGYERFVQSLALVPVLPQVTTPTIQHAAQGQR